MSNEASLGSDAWIEALDYPPETRAEVKANRLRHLLNLQSEQVRKQEQEEEIRRILSSDYVSDDLRQVGHSLDRWPFRAETTDQRKDKEPTPEEVARLAKERAEFKEMMQAKREAKQAARAEEEKGEFLDFMREWIATKWDGEAPDYLKKALSTGDPKDLGMLIHEWHDFKAAKANRAVVASCPTGFVYFVRNGGLFKIGITENMLRRMGELTPDELLNVVRCSNFQEVERELHRRFKDVRLPQTEYFRLSDQQVQEVHQLMVKLADFPQG